MKSKSAASKALAAVRSTMSPESKARVDGAIAARAARAAARKVAPAIVSEPGLAEAIAITEQRIAESNAPAAAVESVTLPVLPEIPAGATHFRLTRKMLEIASDVRRLASDLAALGQRDGDKLEFGTLTANGSFTTNQKALRDPNAPKAPRGTGKMALVDAMILEGTHLARHIAQEVVTKFGGDVEKTLVVVRSRPWQLKKTGKLAADATPFVKALRTVKPKATKEEKAAARAAARAAMEYGV